LTRTKEPRAAVVTEVSKAERPMCVADVRPSSFTLFARGCYPTARKTIDEFFPPNPKVLSNIA